MRHNENESNYDFMETLNRFSLTPMTPIGYRDFTNSRSGVFILSLFGIQLHLTGSLLSVLCEGEVVRCCS